MEQTKVCKECGGVMLLQKIYAMKNYIAVRIAD